MSENANAVSLSSSSPNASVNSVKGLTLVHRLFKALSRALPTAPSTNYQWHNFDVKPYDHLPPNPVIYDVGAQDSRGCYAFGTPPAGAKLLCIDIEAGPGVDVVADAHDLSMIPDGTADCVTAVGMLLHCKYPEKVIGEFHRILKPGGILYIGAPFISPHPAVPAVYYYYSIEGLETECVRFEKLASGFNRGPGATLSHLLVEGNALLFSFNNKTLQSVNLYVFSWLFFWIKYFDVFAARFENAKFFYSGSYFIGRKPAR